MIRAPTPRESVHFLNGGGKMANAMRAYDWSSTALGPLEHWPSSLNIAVGMMVNSKCPKCIVWGPDLVTIHNYAFLPVLGEKPPAAGPSARCGTRFGMRSVRSPLHELATNAVKYGALSNESGGVRIAWSGGRPDTDDAFILRWIEEGGPPVLAPGRKGFGSRIIETVMPHDFGGEATLSYDPLGVRFELRTCMHKIGGSLAPPDQPAHSLPEE